MPTIGVKRDLLFKALGKTYCKSYRDRGPLIVAVSHSPSIFADIYQYLHPNLGRFLLSILHSYTLSFNQ